MKKNVKGFIGLFAGIASVILAVVALCVLTNPIAGTTLALHGSVNVIIAVIAAVLGLAGIVFGVMSLGNTKAKGPRKAGVIVGVCAFLIALSAAGICALTGAFADYANNVPGNAISQMDKDSRQEMDRMVKQLRTDYSTAKTAR